MYTMYSIWYIQHLKMREELLKYKPYKSNFELSSKWIWTKNPNLEKKNFFFLGWGGGGGGVVILVRDTLSWPCLHICEVSWKYFKRNSSYRADTKSHLKPSRGNNTKSKKARVVILVRDTSSWPVLNICEVSWKYFRRYSSYRADTNNTKSQLKPSRGNNSKSKKARVVILVRDTSSWPVLHICKVSWKYFKGYSSYRADTKSHPKPSRGNNSKSKKARVVILVCDTLPWPVLYICKVSWKYFKGYSSYRADTKSHLKPSRGNNSKSKKARVVILVRDTLSWPVLHICNVSWKYSKEYLSYWADTKSTQKSQLKPSRGNNSKSKKARVVYSCSRHIVTTCSTYL